MNKSRETKKITSFIAALAMVVSMIIPTTSPVLAAELSDQTHSVSSTELLIYNQNFFFHSKSTRKFVI